jgi:hypothetical protein
MSPTLPLIFEPDGKGLLDKIARHIDVSMLREISEADYGWKSQEHFEVLLKMRNSGFVAYADYAPQEVLELIRWSEPDQPGWKPGSPGKRGHWMRGFCCASLLRMAGTADMNRHLSFNETIVQLVSSLDALGVDLWADAGSFLSWFVNRCEAAGDRSEDAFLGVALLYCVLKVGDVADATIISLCEWIRQREEAEATSGRFDDDWLHRNSCHDQRREAWTMVGRKTCGLDLRSLSPTAQDEVQLIAASLVSERPERL